MTIRSRVAHSQFVQTLITVEGLLAVLTSASGAILTYLKPLGPHVGATAGVVLQIAGLVGILIQGAVRVLSNASVAKAQVAARPTVVSGNFNTGGPPPPSA